MTSILAIETSCDETAAAVVVDGQRVLSNVVASQIDIHRRFGGVFPEVASRQHVLAISGVIERALDEAGIDHVRQVDAIAVTHGPGLAGSLLVGVNAAKGMSITSGLPLLAVNHLEGHIYSNWVRWNDNPVPDDLFPVLILIVSGGHTELILMREHCRYERLGSTIDDAAGEAFDKVARLLDLGFPGGPAIQSAAEGGNAKRFALPQPLGQYSGREHEHRFNFSFSGLKTAVLNLTRELEAASDSPALDERTRNDVAASFQSAAVDVLLGKLIDAAVLHGVAQVCICGGVSANALLRTRAQSLLAARNVPLFIPPLPLCTDNAAMIGAAAFYRWRCSGFVPHTNLDMDVAANLPLLTTHAPA